MPRTSEEVLPLRPVSISARSALQPIEPPIVYSGLRERVQSLHLSIHSLRTNWQHDDVTLAHYLNQIAVNAGAAYHQKGDDSDTKCVHHR
jgi:two-component sensor histidine kinase